MGAFTQARSHLADAFAAYEPADDIAHQAISGYTPHSFGLGIAGWNEWFLGQPERALAAALDGIAVARRIGYPQTIEQALNSAAHAYLLRRDPDPALALIEPAMEISREQRFRMRTAQLGVLKGWALSAQGNDRDALAVLSEAVPAYRATGAAAWQTNFLVLLANAYGRAGLVVEGLQAIGDARRLSTIQDEHWWAAELRRIEGGLRLDLAGTRDGSAERCYRQAIEVARHQQAKSWELRAATSLARLRGEQGRRTEARDLLAPVYGWFTEGLDTADVIDAAKLLAELA